jgi:deoxyribose-phosphate aldolase
MLECIRERGGAAGFKAAGGIRTVAEAGRYLRLADEIMGSEWTTPAHFRIGASALLALLRAIMRK